MMPVDSVSADTVPEYTIPEDTVPVDTVSLDSVKCLGLEGLGIPSWIHSPRERPRERERCLGCRRMYRLILIAAHRNSPYPNVPEYDYKDLDRKRSKAFEGVAVEAGKRYYDGISEMERIVAHPAYWRRGYGSAIAKWGVELADIDGVDQGVIATGMGADLMEGDERNPEGVTFAALKHTAKAKGSGVGCNVI
ncbi:hypothetical protein B0T24DRAFT_596584 [Lasiosphaeria ovina]|uniref:N-acetyltransferase domain-containing protein n=1 Tax=Lasiosphaeria ovina TaxID=92902 RepID=A0AAE0N1H7_9PEZI|nr:hypothetical protein B0T24DRAFT_596584 [Lasiosphaeria ovina]